ncbi:heparan sulfate glucosamine 3-O-sulfotransferase 5-like [Anneissia japonica]|uniref:heparan sulfate glucosamine 3-O-sulfotransferase 5-like n=1 Tax=Anneissia japonica TaxID=1529436 RepID=UPI001425AF66|nr:heparan sulfate glucosamine 3-O-sulfotransferase 5-like [Anneissia japonica]
MKSIGENNYGFQVFNSKKKILLLILIICGSVLICLLMFGQDVSLQKVICYLKPEQQRNMLATYRMKQPDRFLDERPEDGHPKGMKRRLPQAIIIGVRKGGTRALLELIGIHPDVAKCGTEVHFFDKNENYRLGVEWYRRKMPYSYPHQVTIEKSPAYFITEEAPGRIHQMNASMKLIVIVREPVLRVISDYTQIHELKVVRERKHETFEDLVIRNGDINTSYKAIRISMYSKYINRWKQYFNMNQILIVDGDALIKNPLPELKHVERFLGLYDYISDKNLYLNKTKGFYCMRREDGSSKCLSNSKGRKHPDIDPIVIERLNKFYQPYNEKFYEVVGRTFNWP